MVTILIIGATRGLGLALANSYAGKGGNTVYGSTRSASAPTGENISKAINWVCDIDLMQPNVGRSLVNQLGMMGVGGKMVERGLVGFDVVIITAGYFATEDFTTGPKWDEEVKMYTTSSIAPPFIVHSLFRADLLPPSSKIILVSSESGSISLRHASEGGGNYGHHASKSALNMVGKLLSLDLLEHGVVVSVVHPGFMRTEMTKGVGFDQYWDAGGAVTPEEAAESLVTWVEELGMDKTGEYWAPRGAADIGTAEHVLGPKDKLPIPLKLLY